MYYCIVDMNLFHNGINSALLELLCDTQQINSLKVRPRDRKQIIPSVFILGCIFAVHRIKGFVSGLRPSSDLYSLEGQIFSLAINISGIICIFWNETDSIVLIILGHYF